jgi:UDP-glucose 4-epimerase
MRTQLHFEPRFTTAEAFADFCRELSPSELEGADRG